MKKLCVYGLCISLKYGNINLNMYLALFVPLCSDTFLSSYTRTSWIMHQTIFKVRMHSLLDSKATQQTHKRTNSLYWYSIHRTVQIGNSAVRLYMTHLLDISKPIHQYTTSIDLHQYYKRKSRWIDRRALQWRYVTLYKSHIGYPRVLPPTDLSIVNTGTYLNRDQS